MQPKRDAKTSAAASGNATSPKSLVQQTTHAVIDYMRRNKLQVGDDLPSESWFAQEFAVSRTVVREAFGALAALRLLDVGAGRRARVGAIDHSVMALSFAHAVRTEQMTVQQIWDVRRALEIRTAALAAIQRTQEEADALLRHAREMRRATSKPSMVQHDIAIHRLIAKSTRNALFYHIISSFELVMETTVTYLERPSKKDTKIVLDQHERIARAIADRDPKAAVQAMNDHFDWSLRALVDAGYN